MCDFLVCAVDNDEELRALKGPVVLTNDERCAILRHCKFVDLVVPDVPYNISLDLLDKYNCRYYAHGDDPCYDINGEEITEKFTKLGRYK